MPLRGGFTTLLNAHRATQEGQSAYELMATLSYSFGQRSMASVSQTRRDEQNATLALSVCDFGYVMRRGHIVVRGKPEELRQNPEVLEAYIT